MKIKIVLSALIISLILCGCQPKVIDTAGLSAPSTYTDTYTVGEFVESSPYDVSVSETSSLFQSIANDISSTAFQVTTTRKNVTTAPITASTAPSTQATKPTQSKSIYGIWISCYDHPSASGKSAEEYRAATDKMFKNISEYGFNTAFVHMIAFSDSFYKSDIYPYSAYIAGKEGNSLAYDPFAILLSSAKKYGISVHGWINPFRVSHKSDPSLLSEKNPAKAILNAGNQNGDVCILSNGIYYNPASTSVHANIIKGVKEIIGKYDIDGIHIDDYFYPSTDESIDKKQYSDYLAGGGKLSLKDWRVSSVNAFVSSLYSAVKSLDPSLTVSISPAADIEKNRNTLYADCELWLSTDGYADIIIPQIYFGFEHEKFAFDTMLTEWSELRRSKNVRLLCGIGAYKCGTQDNYAGSGSKEWLENSDILIRQAKSIASNKSYDGFVVYSYSDLTRNGCANEMNRLKSYMKG